MTATLILLSWILLWLLILFISAWQGAKYPDGKRWRYA